MTSPQFPLDEYVILICTEVPPAPGEGGAMDHALREIERAVILALARALGGTPASEVVAPERLTEVCASLHNASKVPIVVWLLSSRSMVGRGPAEVARIERAAKEIGQDHIFVVLSSVPNPEEIVRDLSGVRAYPFPQKGASPATEYWRVLNDLVEDIARVMRNSGGVQGAGVFIAPVANDEMDTAVRLRRNLESRGFQVRFAPEVRPSDSLDSLLDRMAVSVHLFGREYTGSGQAAQLLDVFHGALAYSRNHPDFRVLGWTDALADADRSSLSEQLLREALEFSSRAEIVQSTFEDFKSLLFDRLGSPASTSSTAIDSAGREPILATGVDQNRELYLIFDPRDSDSVPAVSDFLRTQGIAVLLSEFPPDQGRLRAIHHENLRRCDAALIIYGGVQEQWVRMKQQDLLRSAALGRQKRLSAKGVFLCSKRTDSKLRFSAPDLMIINGFESATALAPFIQRLSAA